SLVWRRHGEHGVHATCGALETFLILEVSGNDRDSPFGERRGRRRVWLPRQRANGVPTCQQLGHDVAALLSRRSRHEHVQLLRHALLPFYDVFTTTARSKTLRSRSVTG